VALALGGEAFECWQPFPGFYPYCLAAWPLARAHLQLGQIGRAIGATRRLLEPAHARLPDDLEPAPGTACARWDDGKAEPAGRVLADAVQLARQLGYA
jgi:hypothetical protein